MVDVEYLALGYAAAVATLLVAGWLFWLDPGRTLIRAFSAYLLFRGVRVIIRSTTFALSEDPRAELWFALLGYVDIAATVALVFFGFAYFGKGRVWGAVGRALTALVGLTALAFYAGDHCLSACPEDRSAIGPLSTFTTLGPLVTATLGLLFAFEWNRDRARRGASLALSAGFALSALLDAGAMVVGSITSGWMSIIELNGGSIYAWVFVVGNHFALLTALACVALWATPGPSGKRAPRPFLWLALAVALSAVAADLSHGMELFQGFLIHVIFGFWRFALPGFVVYGLVRHRLFNVDWHVRLGIERGTLVTLAVGAFFIVGQMLEMIMENALAANEPIIKYLGAAGVGLLVFLLHPMQRFARKIAAGSLPNAKPVEDLSDAERLALFREHAQLAWSDGVLQRKERILLDHLRERLQISVAKAHEIERGASR